MMIHVYNYLRLILSLVEFYEWEVNWYLRNIFVKIYFNSSENAEYRQKRGS